MKHDRFRNLDAPKDRSGLEIDPRDARGQRARIRCIECAHENGSYADACEKCHATLLTRAVHRLNVRLHQDEQVAELAQRKAESVVVEQEPERSRLDRIAMRLGVQSPVLARAIVVGAIALAFGALCVGIGWGAPGFVFGMTVTVSVYLVVTRAR